MPSQYQINDMVRINNIRGCVIQAEEVAIHFSLVIITLDVTILQLEENICRQKSHLKPWLHFDISIQ